MQRWCQHGLSEYCQCLAENSTDVRYSFVFTYSGDNRGLSGFIAAIELVMETGFAVTAFVALFLNLFLPEDVEDTELPELTADNTDDQQDVEEWNRIHGSKTPAGTSKDVEIKL